MFLALGVFTTEGEKNLNKKITIVEFVERFIPQKMTAEQKKRKQTIE